MPQLGETVTEGTIIRWLKKVGDHVAHDEPLFEVSTDKVDSEVPSPAEGVLSEILVQEGETVDVGTRLAVVGDSAAADFASAPAAAPPSNSEPSPPPAEAPPPEAPPPALAPSAAAPAPAGPAPEPPSAPARPNPSPGGRGPEANGGTSSLLSPVVRKLLADNGIDPREVTGTGAGGRITRNDVLAYIDSRAASGPSPAPASAPSEAVAAGGPRPAPAFAPGSAPRAASAFPPAAAGERDEVVPFTNIRRLTAEHMVRSKATSAHTLVAIEADYEAIERVRRASRERFKAEEGISLTYLAFVARAVVDVLRDFPHLNASVGEDALLVHRDVNLGIAVDLDRQGLIVPVVRNADGQSLRGLARAIADLAERARTRRLSADDIVGGTFTITNPGPFGTFLTAPIINQPQVAILSTDGVKRRPVVVTSEDGSEAIAIHSVGVLALSFDHRAVDGAYASAFLYNLARELETRDWAAEL
jgi:pyruvate dehydrogenase E2 component (dihydrolipoamide acetyltransferase)